MRYNIILANKLPTAEGQTVIEGWITVSVDHSKGDFNWKNYFTPTKAQVMLAL